MPSILLIKLTLQKRVLAFHMVSIFAPLPGLVSIICYFDSIKIIQLYYISKLFSIYFQFLHKKELKTPRDARILVENQ